MAEKNIIRVTKSYTRKVSLKSLTSQYDNVECGTVMTALISFSDEKEFDNKMQVFDKLVIKTTENEMHSVIENVAQMTQDVENKALVGLGSSLQQKTFLEEQLGTVDITEILSSIEEAKNAPTLSLEEAD